MPLPAWPVTHLPLAAWPLTGWPLTGWPFAAWTFAGWTLAAWPFSAWPSAGMTVADMVLTAVNAGQRGTARDTTGVTAMTRTRGRARPVLPRWRNRRASRRPRAGLPPRGRLPGGQRLRGRGRGRGRPSPGRQRRARRLGRAPWTRWCRGPLSGREGGGRTRRPRGIGTGDRRGRGGSSGRCGRRGRRGTWEVGRWILRHPRRGRWNGRLRADARTAAATVGDPVAEPPRFGGGRFGG